MYKRILVATDGSELALHAAEHAIALAKSLGAAIVALYASPPFATPVGFEFVPAPLLPVDVYTESTKAAAKRYLGDIESRAAKAGRACTRCGRPTPSRRASSNSACSATRLLRSTTCATCSR